MTTSIGPGRANSIGPAPVGPARATTSIRLRRLLPRHLTDWRGKYRIEGDPADHWRECRVVDISAAGAGLELSDSTPEEIVGRNIVLSLELKADVRYSREGSEEQTRVGIQFVEMTDAKKAYIDSLTDCGPRW